MMKNTVLLFSLLLALFFVSCDNPTSAFPDGTITVEVTGLDTINAFDSGTSDVYFFAFDSSDSLVAHTKFDGARGSSVKSEIGVPEHTFEYGVTYYVDVVIDIDGDDDRNTGTNYWLTEYVEVKIDGDMEVSVSPIDFDVRNPAGLGLKFLY